MSVKVADIIDSMSKEEPECYYELVLLPEIKNYYGDKLSTDFCREDVQTILANMESVVKQKAHYPDDSWSDMYAWLGKHSEYAIRELPDNLCKCGETVQSITMYAQTLWHRDQCRAELRNLIKKIQKKCAAD